MSHFTIPQTPLSPPSHPYSTPGPPGQPSQTSYLSPVPSDPLPCNPHRIICHTVTLVTSHLSHQDPWHQVQLFISIPLPYWEFPDRSTLVHARRVFSECRL